jgi:hypothetical protein
METLNRGKKVANGSTAAIIFAVFAAACVVAFLAYRGSDIGQLPKLVGNLGGGPLFGAGIVDSFVGVLTALLIVLSWFGLGSFITRFVKGGIGRSRIFEIVFATAIGAEAWSLVWFFLGLGGSRTTSGSGAGLLSFIGSYVGAAGLYSRPVAVAAVLIGVSLAVIAVLQWRGIPSATNASERRSVFENGLLLLTGFPIFLAFIASLASPIAKDTLLYHFSVPKEFIAQGGSRVIEGNIASYLPLGAEMFNVWAMLLGGSWNERVAEAAAGVVNFAFFALLIAVVYAWSRELGLSRAWSMIAGTVLACVPTVFYVASSGYVDNALALFVTLGIYAIFRWWTDTETSWMIYAAIFFGAALSIKFTALVVIAAAGLMTLLRARQAKDDPAAMKRIVLNGFGALLLAGLIASPWYVRTWKETGSPVFPFYMNIWKGDAPEWDVARSELFQQMNAQYGGASKDVVDYVLSAFNISIIAQPELHEYFDGVIGPAFLIGLPLLIFGLWKFDVPEGLKAGLGVAAVLYLFWLFSSQQLRYLVPILPLLAVAIVYCGEAITKRLGFEWIAKSAFAAAAVACVLVSSAWFLQAAPLREVLGGETRDEYLARNLDYYPYYKYLNTETAPDAKVWLINMRRDTYNLDRPVFSDYLFEDWTLRKMIWESRNVQEMRAKTAAMGIQYVLARHDILFDPKNSTLIDDDKPKSENDAKLAMAREFLMDPSRTIKSDNRFSLVKVF